MTLTSWPYREIKKMIIYVNFMPIYVNNIRKFFFSILIYVDEMQVLC
jgi:hypothetical protein